MTTVSILTVLAVFGWLLVGLIVHLLVTEKRRGGGQRRRPATSDAFVADVPIEKRHYYGTLTDEERGPICYMARQLIMRPGSSAIWHGTKVEERITIVAPR